MDVTTENKRSVETLYEEGINGGDATVLARLVAEDYEGGDGERGADGFGAIVSGLRSAFPDIRFVVDDLVAEGDRVTIRWSWTGTFDKPFRGLAPTGKPVSQSGIVIYQLRDGKVVRSWRETNRLGFLQQVGVVPSDSALRAQNAPPR
jgi:steroid delta-isomerase-like uncharacterized protein